MKKFCAIFLAVVLMLGLFAVNVPVSKAATASGSDSNITVTITPNPASLSEGADVTFSVKVTNNSSSAIDNFTVAYEGLEQASLSQVAAGDTKTVTFTKKILTEQLGTPLTFEIGYSIGGTPGGFDVKVQVDKKVPEAKVSFSCDGDRTACPVGGNVNFTFRVENTGEATITNVQISLPPSNGGKVIKTFSSLAPGVAKTVSYTHTMKEDVTLTPTLKYTANGVEQTITKDPKTISVAEPKLTLELSADNTKPAVGAEVNFTLKITNSGNALLNKITVYDHLQQVIKEDLSLMPAKSTTLTGKYTFNQTTDVQFSVTAQDKDGVKYPYSSNKVKISIPIDSSKIKLELEAKADPYELSEAGPVKFSVTVKNKGSYPLTEVTVTEDKLGQVGTIDYLEAGVDKLVSVPDATVSDTTTYKFKVTAKDPDGNTINTEALPLEIKLTPAAASSNPLESATDVPTETAAAKGDTLGTIIIIMIVIAVLIIAVVVALVIMVNKEKKNKARSSSAKTGAIKTVKYRNKNNF